MAHNRLLDVVRRDPRYAYEAYEFLFEALAHTQERLGRPPVENEEAAANPDNHVSGKQLVDGFLNLASLQFGRMARVVLHLWGVDATDDVGELVFNLIEEQLLSKTDNDRREDFCGLCNLDTVLVDEYQIVLSE